MDKNVYQFSKSGVVGLIFATIIFLFIPPLIGGLWLNVLTSTGCFSLAVAGCSLMYSKLGMVSLTQVGLMGVGGWVTLRLNYYFDFSFEINLLIGTITTTLFGIILALPALRMRGLYLALTTLMAAGALEILFATFQFPNGGNGFWGVQTGSNLFFKRPAIAQSDIAYLRYVVALVTISFFIVELHRRTKPGRAWALIKRSEAVALSSGVNVMFYKSWAFGISGALAGLGGGLLAGSLGLLDGGTFRASESIMIFALAIVGGTNSWLGVIIAASLFRILPAILNNLGLDADLSYIIFGAGLLHAVINAPFGISGQIYEAISKFQRVKNSNTNKEIKKNQNVKFKNRGANIKSTTNVVMRDVTVRFGGVVALENISVDFTQSVNGIIGPNGAGKTTLMNVFSGFIVNQSGNIKVDDINLMQLSPHNRSRWGLRRSFQKEEIANDLTIKDNIKSQLDSLKLSNKQKQIELESSLNFVGLLSDANKPGKFLNKFEKRLTDIAKCVVGYPNLILFDEPAGGMSIEETKRLGSLIKNIKDYCGAQTIIIDHDVDLISNICKETLVLDFGKKIAFGNTKNILQDPKVISAYLGFQ